MDYKNKNNETIMSKKNTFKTTEIELKCKL